MKRRLGLGLSGATGDILAQIDPVHVKAEQDDDEEQLAKTPAYDEPMALKHQTSEDEEL